MAANAARYSSRSPMGIGLAPYGNFSRAANVYIGMISRTNGFTVSGIEGLDILVEVDIARGLPACSIVGLPDAAVKESRERIVSAMRNSAYDFPERKIIIN